MSERSCSIFYRLFSTSTAVLLVVVIALAGRVVFFSSKETGDQQRYLTAAKWISSGEGFGPDGKLGAKWPHGYPMFLACVLSFNGSLSWVRMVQISLSLTSCFLVYQTIAWRDRRFAFIAATVIAMSPLMCRYASLIVSEVFSVFLMSLLFWIISRNEQSDSLIWPTSIGALCVAAVLTAPGTLFICFLLLLAVVYKNKARPLAVLLVHLGALALLVPWQTHCLMQTGRLQPTIYDHKSTPTLTSGFALWFRTWHITEYSIAVFRFNQPKYWHERAPNRAFSSNAQKDSLTRTYEEFSQGRLEWESFDAVFREAAVDSIDSDPMSFYVILPAARSLLLWFYPQSVVWPDRSGPLGHIKWYTDAPWRVKWWSTLAWRSAIALLFIVLMGRALRTRDPVALAIVGGVVLFTLAGSVLAQHEARRCMVFYPAILFLSTRQKSVESTCPYAPTSTVNQDAVRTLPQ